MPLMTQNKFLYKVFVPKIFLQIYAQEKEHNDPRQLVPSEVCSEDIGGEGFFCIPRTREKIILSDSILDRTFCKMGDRKVGKGHFLFL